MRSKVNILFESWLVLESTRSDWLAARDCERHSKAPLLIARDLAIFDVNSIKEEVNLKWNKFICTIYATKRRLHYYRPIESKQWAEVLFLICKSLNRQFSSVRL